MVVTYAPTLYEHILPASPRAPSWLRDVIVVLLGSLLLTLSAKIAIPFYPVPQTLQTLVVLCLGFALGPRLGVLTVLVYLAQGALGLPVFARAPELGIGPAYISGPTGGYLLGFLVAAIVVGSLARHGWDRNLPTMIVGMVLGNAIIYVFGLFWLGQVIGWDKPIYELGLTPFLLGDAVKIGIAACAVPYLWRLLERQ
jgi:biotin transport system substrate-specific component